jgi:hypothetical protein
MKIIPARFVADDATEFSTEAECLEYEARAPLMKLLADVRLACDADAGFSDEIERLGRQRAALRIERGERKRRRKGDNGPADPPINPYYEPPNAPGEAREDDDLPIVGPM